MPSAGVSDGWAFIVEAPITFLLVFVIMAAVTDKRVPAALADPLMGFALVAAVLIGGGITGGAINPDRALGPVIVTGAFTGIRASVAAAGSVACTVGVQPVAAQPVAAPTISSAFTRR